jgi:hypothetical protein
MEIENAVLFEFIFTFARTVRGMSYFKKAIVFAFSVKLLYIIIGNLFPGGWNGFDHILDVLSRNDSGWYHQIARDGYPLTPPVAGEQSPFAFFPLYPALIALLRPFYYGFMGESGFSVPRVQRIYRQADFYIFGAVPVLSISLFSSCFLL